MPEQNQDSLSPFSYPPGWGEKIKPEEPTLSEPEKPVTALHLEKKSKLGFIRKLLPVFLALLLIVVAGAAVFKFILPRFQKPQEVTLDYWGLWEPAALMKGVLSEWEKEHPDIKVNYTQHSHREYRERLQSALARGEGPDIFRFHITWLPMFKNELGPIPNTVMNAAQFESTYYPIASANLRAEGGYLGIPLEVDTLALFINQEIFQAAGKVPPTSWSELRRLALELKTPQNNTLPIQTAGVALGTTGNVEHWSDILGLLMLQNNTDFTQPAACVQVVGEEQCYGADALKFYTLFNKEDNVWNETLPNSTLAFATGKVAMYFGYSWDVFEIKNINPDLDFRIVPAPQLPGTEVSWASFWVEGVARKSKHQTEAWEFLKFLSSPSTMEKLYLAESQIRLFGEPYARMEMAERLANDPMVAPFIRQMPRAQTWYLCSRTWDNGINDRMIKYFEDAVNAVNAGKSPKEALTTATSGINQLLSQYGLASRVVQ